MIRQLEKLIGRSVSSASSQDEFDPVYGLPRRSVEQWLAQNPQLREQYQVEEWLARNPMLRAEADTAEKQRRLP